MGRMYRPIFVQGADNERLTVAFVDSGADETVISKKLAQEIGVETYGVYKSYSASGDVIEGVFALITIKDGNQEMEIEVGVSDTPFNSDYSDEEGVELILGLDFLQEAKVSLDFSN